MRFLQSWVSFILPRSAFATALFTRTRDLQQISNPFELDGVKLTKHDSEGIEEPFFIESVRDGLFGRDASQKTGLLTHKSRISDGSGGGVLLTLSATHLLFIGLTEELLRLAVDQDFAAIMRYKYEARSATKSIEGIITKTQVKELGLQRMADRKSGYVQFSQRGQIHYSPEGIVFSIVSLEQLRG